jgi:hypothetical protein
MGNYLRKEAYSGQWRRVRAAFERLSDATERLRISEPRSALESHPSLPVGVPLSLQSVIAVTDHLLDEQAKYALSALAAFAPGFSEEAAWEVSSVEVLDVLIDVGLLESNNNGFYTLHPTIADYARVRFSQQL